VTKRVERSLCICRASCLLTSACNFDCCIKENVVICENFANKHVKHCRAEEEHFDAVWDRGSLIAMAEADVQRYIVYYDSKMFEQ